MVKLEILILSFVYLFLVVVTSGQIFFPNSASSNIYQQSSCFHLKKKEGIFHSLRGWAETGSCQKMALFIFVFIYSLRELRHIT